MRLYPGQRHGVRGGALSVNLYEMMTDFLVRTLAAEHETATTQEGGWLGH